MEEWRHKTDPTAFDPVSPGRATAQDRGLLRFHCNLPHLGPTCLQPLDSAEKTAAHSDVGAERAELAAKLIRDLEPDLAIPIESIPVVELVRGEATNLF
ncbi:hypothetical protein BH18ACT6_BH18ACT6_04920 [soil metagenome]